MANKKLDDLLARMAGFDDITTDFRGMFYGDSGVGKTVFAMELAQAITPQGLGILYVDARDGWATLKNHPDLQTRTKRLRLEKFDDLVNAGEAIRDKEGVFGFIGTVVLDESSTMYSDDLEAVLRASLGINPVEIPSRPPEWPEYFKAQKRFEAVMNLLDGVDGLNIIQVAHLRQDKQTPTATPTWTPDFQPGISKSLRKPLHVLGLMKAKLLTKSTDQINEAEYERDIQVHPSTFVVAKTRVGGLPPKVEPAYLIQEITAWLGSEQQMADLATEAPVTVVAEPRIEEGDAYGDEDDAPLYTE